MTHQPLNILITKNADSDEETIYKYISRKFGKIYADKFRSKIIDLFKKLAITPTAGRITKNDRSLRVFIFNSQNKVIYKTTEIEIIIIRILSSKRKTSAKY
jgi:plasmid stabilization system protein ParE